MGADRTDDVIPSPAKDLCQQGAHIFIQVECYRRHADSVCWSMRRSRRARWS
jgi:hypothetical protein